MPQIKISPTDQNILGRAMPTIYVDGVDYLLPTVEKGNRAENFVKVSKTWVDIDNIIQERVKGYRLVASYTWEILSNSDAEDLITIYNATKDSRDIRIKFSTFPRHYRIRIPDDGFNHSLAEGYSFRSSVSMDIEGVGLVRSFPTADQFITITPQLFQGSIIRTIVEQEATN